MGRKDEFAGRNTPLVEDLVIVGGGAGGVGVLLQMIEKVKEGKPMRAITLVERSKEIGPGVAYSQGCTGAILNMHADGMGLYATDPTHFSRWRKQQYPGREMAAFPHRTEYGQYLCAQLGIAMDEAKRLGFDLRVINDEVLDLFRIEEGLELELAQGPKLRAHDVVLAIGNYDAITQPSLLGTPGYFPSPWPNNQLRYIPRGASVSILGSRLSAIDTAIFLAENGHQGPINFVSRNGRLPRVQGSTAPWERRYTLNDIAKEVEGRPDEAFNIVFARLLEEIQIVMGAEWSGFTDKADGLEQFRSDIRDAENGEVQWQAVLKETNPFLERYWSSFSAESRHSFQKDYISTWMTIRHSIPIQNARKILALIDKGQLRVTQGDTAKWDGSAFTIAAEEAEVKSQFLIEAVGLELNPRKVPCQLLQRLVSRGTLQAHPAGGVEVDFDTCVAEKGIHVIGSMTKGVHFHTSSIDRSVAHAARIADDLAGVPLLHSQQIGLFVGSDLFSQLMVNKLVPQIINSGHTPYIFLPKDKTGRSSDLFGLRELAFFERELLQQHVLPYVRDSSSSGATCLTAQQMRSHYGILVEEVDSVNDASFLDSLRSHYINIGISIGSYQRFGKSIIDFFESPKALLNLHPGVLPSYRGVMTTARAMENGEENFGYSLHEVNEDFDAGKIFDIRTHRIDYQKSVLQNMDDVNEIGAQMAVDAVDKLGRGKRLPAIQQDSSESHYYNLPAKKELDEFRQHGIGLVEPAAMVDIMVRSYASPGEEVALRRILEVAIKKWYAKEVRQYRCKEMDTGTYARTLMVLGK